MRRITRAQLRHWDLAMLTDDATLVVSELVGNAIKHGSVDTSCGPELSLSGPGCRGCTE